MFSFFYTAATSNCTVKHSNGTHSAMRSLDSTRMCRGALGILVIMFQSKYWLALYTVVQLTELRMVSVWINRKKNIFHGPIPGDMACQPKAWHDVLPMGIVWINYLLMFPFLAGCGHAKFVTSPGAYRTPAGV